MTRIENAFILAAGMGTRMRPLTDHTPKPLVSLFGKSLLGHCLDRFAAQNITECVINSHYLGEQISEFIKTQHDHPFKLIESPENQLLETGGGLQKGLKLFTDPTLPFFVTSGDSYWEDSANHPTVLDQLTTNWDADKMDILMALYPTNKMKLTQSSGDYHIDDTGTPIRAHDKSGTHMFTSLRIVSPRIFDRKDDTPYSFLELMDEAEEKGRLAAIEMQGIWHHLSTPEDIKCVETDKAGD